MIIRYIAPALVATLFPLMAVAAEPSASIAEAARTGDDQALQMLVKQRADVNLPGPDGATALHWAADRGDLTAVDLLLRAGARVATPNRYGVTPMSLAAANGSVAVIERLLKGGASPNASVFGGETALMTASRAGQLAAVQALLNAGANVNASEETRGQTALMWAAAEGHADVVRALLVHGADLKATSHGPVRKDTTDGDLYFKRTAPRLDVFRPVQFAVRGGHIDATLALLAAGANINDELPDGMGLLTLAIANAHFDLAAALIEKGADVNAARVGWTPLHQAVRVVTTNILFGPPRPQLKDHVTTIELATMLLSHGADVNARTTKAWSDGYRGGDTGGYYRSGFGLNATPFLLAAKGADVNMMSLLAAHGADVAAPNVNGTTPLMATAGVEMMNPNEDSGRDVDALAAMQLALKLGAGDINAVNNQDGSTALHGAISRVSLDFVKLLVEHGAKLDIKNKRGLIPMEVALGSASVYGVRIEAAQFLRERMLAAGLDAPEAALAKDRYTFGVKVAE